MNNVAVIGLGYVGLPLALLAEEKKFNVLGVDLDVNKIQKLQKGESPIEEGALTERVKTSKIKFTIDMDEISKSDIAIICVPTPVSENKIPDLTILKKAAVSVANELADGALLVIESTINPGVCDEIIIPIIEARTRHKIGKSLHIAHCPERINPGDPKWHVGNINRVLGANSPESLEKAFSFYTTLIDAQIKKMDNIKEAEACKIVENSFRDVNIAFVNELAMSFQKLGINVVNVIDGAATKPFAFMAHYPGIGVGGHCIPVDPYYLIEYAKTKGFDHHFLSLARTINENMPIHSVDRLEQELIENSLGGLEGKTVSVLGLSYKSNVGDDRESPAYVVISELLKRGALVKAYDPHIPRTSALGEKNLKDTLKDADAAILVTFHNDFNLEIILQSGIKIFLDGRNAFLDDEKSFLENNVRYLGI